MARRRDFVRGAAAISQRRLTSWLQFQPAQTAFSAAGGTVLATLNAAALALRPFTVVRSRFKYLVVTDTTVAAEIQVGAIGMAVVSDQASAIGVTAVPTPITDMGSDLWFLHEMFAGDSSLETDRSLNGTQEAIDSKAMRKVDIGQDIVIVAELSTAGSGFQLTLGGRMLIKVN